LNYTIYSSIMLSLH